MSHEPMIELSNLICEMGGGDLTKCFQCGTCTGVCPWNFTASMEMRRMIHMAQLGLEGFEGEDLWRCVTCNTCVERCPRGVGLTDVVAAARSVMIEGGNFPSSIRGALANMKQEGNPWQGLASDRFAWAEGLDVPVFDPGTHDVLLFSCCTPAYDPRTKKVARALVTLLQKAGVSFGVMGEGETCCGDLALRTGDQETYEPLATELNERLQEKEAPTVLVLSPHCMETFKSYVPQPKNVVHHSEFLLQLVKEGKLTFSQKVEQVFTYHDPCYLGRRNQIYDDPRELLLSLEGAQLKEMGVRIRERGICCGGGGGGAFSETEPQERLGMLRAQQAGNTEAQVLATACPYCVLMLEDGVLAAGLDEQLVVRDIAEILAEAL